MSRAKTVNEAQILFTFGPSFLHDHLGQIIDDPTVAIVELVANCYDAGADRVDIRWPEMPGQPLSITDNGTGTTHEEFLRRWRTLSYDRAGEQGTEVVSLQTSPSAKGLPLVTTAGGDSARFVLQTTITWTAGATTGVSAPQ